MKKRLSSLFLVVCVLLTGLSLPSCGIPKEKYSTYSFDYFDTVTSIIGYEETREKFDKVSEQLLSSLGEYHRLYTIYHRYDGLENLCTVNELSNGSHRTVTVDRRIIDLLLYAKEMYTLTGGRVNIAMGSVLSVWHDYREIGMNDPSRAQLPPMEKLIEASEHTDIEKMVIDEEACTVTLTDPDMKLDVGAIAKGYAVEMVARELEAQGIDGYVLNVGGNVRTVGARADGEKWTVGIDNPDGEGENAYFAEAALAGEALVTSGSYQRYYVVDGERYHHIIDRDTLMPARGYLSVSVICRNSGAGDALSTALFCMSLSEGMALVDSLSDTEALWVMEDGTKHTSAGFEKYENN
ncbi:MAG: FAD:protein FMN transferase [Ruminococcaceae bacterium]|nr:FAD:protein FMN transferase [Oscillospiraceae bacterium]